MSVSTSIIAYQDCIEFMDRAIADDTGARLKVIDYADAVVQRTRIHYARKLHRDENAKTYEQGHQMHGRSEYDALVCRIKKVGEDYYIYLERTDKVKGKIESLSGLDEPTQIAHEPPRQIEHKPEPPKVAIHRRV